MSEEWLSAWEAFGRISATKMSGAERAIFRRAADGLILTKARLFVYARDKNTDIEVPADFWRAVGDSPLEQNWHSGDFAAWINSMTECRAYGVTFRTSDIDEMVPRIASWEPIEPGTESQNGASTQVYNAAGRTRNTDKWAVWTAELVTYVHENGIPEGHGANGQDKLIEAVDKQLIANGQDALSRSAVQPIVRAVLLRLRSARN